VKNGIISLLLLGIVAVLLLLGIFIFGPWELSGFGQLSQRQGEQAASAAEIAFPGPDDADKDGFKDSVEKWIKTDPADNCADDARDAAWPPDLNNDKKVDQTDTDAFKPYMFKRVKDSNRRFDLNTDKQINIIDVNLLRQYYGKSCPYYFLGGSSAVHEVKLNWVPGLQLISKNAYTQIRYGDMTQAQTTECSDTNSVLTGSNAGTLISSDFGIKSSPALQEGQTSYIWNSNTSNYAPIPGHKYCLYIMQSNEARSASAVVSNFLQVETKLYSLSAVPSFREIVFNWTPALQYDPGYLGIYWGDMTASGKTECNSLDDLPTGSFAGALTYDLQVGQTSFVWNSSTTNYSVAPGHKYCTYMFQGPVGGALTPSSNVLDVTVPDTSPSPPPPTNNTIIP